MSTSDVLALVTAERARQDLKWGTPEARPLGIGFWLMVFAEEVGEVMDECVCPVEGRVEMVREMVAVAGRFARRILTDPTGESSDARIFDLRRFRTELVQVAAVAVAMIEALNASTPPPTEAR